MLANKLWPEPLITSWRRLVLAGCPWKYRHVPFAILGTDTFLIVSPGGIILNTADANVIAQVMARGTDFVKPTVSYKSLDIYGQNIVSAEGAAWRHHRKLTSPAFSEKNNRLVWKETLYQSGAMLAAWVGHDASGKTIHRVARDTMRLSLNVMSHAGLGRKMEWPKADEEGEGFGKENLPEGHTMTFTYSLQCLLNNLLYLMFLPKWLLSKSANLGRALCARILISSVQKFRH